MPELTARKTLHRLKCEEVFMGGWGGGAETSKIWREWERPQLMHL
jgi:hypothetical protein